MNKVEARDVNIYNEVGFQLGFLEDVLHLEDVLQEVIKRIKSTSGKMSIKNNNRKQWGKACLPTGGGVSNYRSG